jgi:hypothetical protein
MQDLPNAVNALLEQAQHYYGLGPAYQALVQQVQAVVAQILAMGPQAQPAPGPNAAALAVTSAPRAQAASFAAAQTASAPFVPQTAVQGALSVNAISAGYIEVGELRLPPFAAAPAPDRRPAEPPVAVSEPRGSSSVAQGDDGAEVRDLRSLVADRDREHKAENAKLRGSVANLADKVEKQQEEIRQLNQKLDRLLGYLEAQARRA